MGGLVDLFVLLLLFLKVIFGVGIVSCGLFSLNDEFVTSMSYLFDGFLLHF